MIIQSLLIPKESLKTVTTGDDLSVALKIMEETGQRCIPILDASNTLYRGNIYKYHIYQHLAKSGTLSDSVTALLKNATKFVLDTDSFFTTFFTLSDLPYISVLNKQHHFLGIIRHSDMTTMLSQTWQLTDASYALTIELTDMTNSLIHVLKIIKKFTDIKDVISLNKDTFSLRTRVIVTLPKSFDEQSLERLTKKLAAKQFVVIDVEDLTSGI